jgi:hypothetical protein
MGHVRTAVLPFPFAQGGGGSVAESDLVMRRGNGVARGAGKGEGEAQEGERQAGHDGREIEGEKARCAVAGGRRSVGNGGMPTSLRAAAARVCQSPNKELHSCGSSSLQTDE